MSASARSIALAVLLLTAGLAASLAGIVVGEGARVYAATLVGNGLMALSVVGAFFIVRGRRRGGSLDESMTAPSSRNRGPAALLVFDGVVLTLVGVAIAEIDDAPGAALIGFVVLLIDLTAAFFVVRRARRLAGLGGGANTSAPKPALAALLGINGVILMLAFWMIGRFLDPPGAPGVGALMLAVNLIAAVLLVRRGR